MAHTDITLLGATGFTGGLTADYLAKHLPEGATWAIAGRSRSKLEEVARRIDAAGGVRPEIVEADTGDDESLAAMAARTRVVVTTVGPYLKYGEGVVRAAAEAGIAYVDLTGEPQFVDEMWLRYHATAEASGARIVHACGFDSIPYDLGVLATVLALPEGVPLRVRGYIRAAAEFSGGTYHSAINQMSSLRQSARVAGERRSAEERPAGRVVKGGGRAGRADGVEGWGIPLPTLDPLVVLRSARALERYGPDFRYEHYAHLKTLRMTVAGGLGLGVATLAAQVRPLRALMLKAKDPGDGPSEATREKSWFRLTVIGEGGGRTARTLVKGGDPGYTETSRMLAESALCLAFDDLPAVSGQVTTAVAMGVPLIERLQAAGISFETEVS
ncbi:saccharopine dehydrogenase [Aeromicrobium marinum DSM 15272]|uniref:Saccharopine dehydrogenase n=1 Tax=Aeromicrobium marinum DSM 15272 TaxID=585531 RepID=E2SB95_9ACTN|nr:saccharopine dehydrogenase NADP-binding domain-containing protein [Aeromicrobium marinum]EFQ83641.1 saccharopine dehydrogenase [Aeromicrobium marinum DSM 15272]